VSQCHPLTSLELRSFLTFNEETIWVTIETYKENKKINEK
jgi:hypothetical protein